VPRQTTPLIDPTRDLGQDIRAVGISQLVQLVDFFPATPAE
jgi:hypothetical protein